MQHGEKMDDGSIWVYHNGQYERELICAEKWMRLIYENPAGRATLLWLVKRKMLSHLYGFYCRSSFSARKIPQFIEENQVDMSGSQGPYKNFAEFFTREKNNIAFPAEGVGSPCEGLVSVYDDIDPERLISAKGSYFSLAELFEDSNLAEAFSGGTMVRIRLTPANYHRMHFFDEGTVVYSKFLDGDLFSVSPLALKKIANLYCRNKRAVFLFASKHFGEVVFVEVGATFVGSIVHCFKDGEPNRRGQLASYFMPGGSLVLMFFKKDTFLPKDVLLEQTAAGFETKIHVGAALD